MVENKNIRIVKEDAVLGGDSVSYTHLRAHETGRNLVCRLLLEKKNPISYAVFCLKKKHIRAHETGRKLV